MSEFLTKNNFYQIRDVLPKVKVGIIDYNATRKINEPLQVQRNQKIDFKFDKNKIIDHKTQIIDLNYFPDILDFLGSDAYVVFPSDTLFYKSALMNEFAKRTFFHKFPNGKNLAYNPLNGNSIYHKDAIIPIVFLSTNNEFCDENFYHIYDKFRFPYCFPFYYGYEYIPKIPWIWITNFYDKTYAFI